MGDRSAKWKPGVRVPMFIATRLKTSRSRLRVLPVAALLLVSSEVCADNWQCSNDFESRCSSQGCSVATTADFTPLSVSLDDRGALSVCAYSGCWQGRGEVLATRPYLVVVGSAIPWSAPGGDHGSDMVLTLNPKTGVAMLQNEVFDQPLVCAGP